MPAFKCLKPVIEMLLEPFAGPARCVFRSPCLFTGSIVVFPDYSGLVSKELIFFFNGVVEYITLVSHGFVSFDC